LLCEYTKSDSLRKHGLAVEAVMRRYALQLGQDHEVWGIVGLLHDFDYEMYPAPPDHPLKGSEVLAARGYSEQIRRAILGHATYTGVPRDTLLARALYACDELTGFVIACSLVRPSGIWDLESRSVLDQHIDFIIGALRDVAPDVGLKPRDP